MKTKSRSFLACLLLTPFVLAGTGVGDKLGFQPKDGTTLAKEIQVEAELELEDMTFELNGQDMSEMAGKVDMAMKTSMKLGVTDQYEGMSDGRPSKLKRSFDEINSTTHISGSNAMTGDKEQDIPAASELEGTTVVFSWDDGDSAYDVAFDGDKKGDEALLENLEENLDLRGFLPGKEIAEGDSWKVPADAVKAALAPGGDIKLRPTVEGEDMNGMDQLSPTDMIGNLEGEFEATYSGSRKEGDARVGVIKLKLSAKAAQDMSDKADLMRDQMVKHLPEGMTVDISAFDGEYEYEAEGELLWNLDTGLPHSLHLSGEVRMIVDISMNMSTPQGDQAMEQSLKFAGSQTITLSTGA